MFSFIYENYQEFLSLLNRKKILQLRIRLIDLKYIMLCNFLYFYHQLNPKIIEKFYFITFNFNFLKNHANESHNREFFMDFKALFNFFLISKNFTWNLFFQLLSLLILKLLLLWHFHFKICHFKEVWSLNPYINIYFLNYYYYFPFFSLIKYKYR